MVSSGKAKPTKFTVSASVSGEGGYVSPSSMEVDRGRQHHVPGDAQQRLHGVLRHRHERQQLQRVPERRQLHRQQREEQHRRHRGVRQAVDTRPDADAQPDELAATYRPVRTFGASWYRNMSGPPFWRARIMFPGEDNASPSSCQRANPHLVLHAS